MSKRGSAEIAAEVRAAIATGRYRRFERLPASRQMADELGVARNTLRDALYQLEREGLLETRASSGTYVMKTGDIEVPAAVEEATPLELIDARFALEPHICRLCVLHGRREDIELLETLCQRMEAAIGNPAEFSDADTAFHKTLAATTRNDLLIWLIGQITTVRSLDEWTRMRHLTLDESIISLYNTQHREILNAIRAREPERAAAKMKEHLETARLSLTRASDT
ncbi:MAG: FCD domain-containing protein [Pseudomonadota bacterium]